VEGHTAGASATQFFPGSSTDGEDSQDDGGDDDGGNENASTEVQGPVCWYEPLRHTTQDEQRTEIRPEEQRPGLWGWEVCDDGTQRFRFFPDGPEAPAPAPRAIDPAVLAAQVALTPEVPPVRTSPPADALHLVNLETWFWVDPADWSPQGDGAQRGTVEVSVTATPVTLVIDPGDGSAPLRCPGGGTPYNPDLPADAQTSTCTHTYTEPGDYTPTATVVYDITWTSNLVPGGTLPDITPPGEPFDIQVAEGQAVIVDRLHGARTARSGAGR
jgi:hypothetical protein